MPVQKLVLQLTVMCDTDTLEEAVDAYSSMTLEQIQHSTAFGEDIGSGVSIVASETIDGREKIVAELQEIGNDGTFFDYAFEEEDAQVSATRAGAVAGQKGAYLHDHRYFMRPRLHTISSARSEEGRVGEKRDGTCRS